MTSNQQLAERARQLARSAPNGSVARRAALVAAIALAEGSSATAAAKILDAWDGPDDIKAAATELIATLTREPR
jgi:hypothetical protein